MDKPASFAIFELLYWCGIREGEALALMSEDFDFQKSLLRITKSYQRIDGRDVVTAPKTAKSVRTVAMPDFVAEEVEEYMRLESCEEGERIFPFGESYLCHEMERGCKASGVKRIRVHALCHSHVPAHRDGVQHRCDRKPRGARERRHHVPLRAPVPKYAGRHGAQAEPGEEIRG